MSTSQRLSLPLTSESLTKSTLILWSAVIVIATFVAYWPAMHAGFVWDDDDHVTLNIHVHDPAGLKPIWLGIVTAWKDRERASDINVRRQFTPQYYPLVFTTFWAEYQLFGANPVPYHITNIALHAAGAVALWFVLRRLSVPGSWIIAAVFALHPVHVESVAWISERKNTLSALFYFLSLLAYLTFAPLDNSRHADAIRRWSWYWPALGCFVLALTSKTVTCSLPAAILVLTWWKRGRIQWRDIFPTLPFLAIGLVAGLNTAWFEKTYIWGGQQSEYTYSLLERTLIAGRVVWFYAGKLLWPTNLAFIYERWTIDAGQWWQYAFPVSAMVVVIVLFGLRKRIGRGPLAAVLLFGGTLFPAMGFFDVYPFRFSFVADHFQHLASVALSALIIAWLVEIFRRLNLPEWPNGTIATGSLLVVLGGLTFKQCHIYQDVITLWNDTVIKSPRAWMPHNNLGELLRREAQHMLNTAQQDGQRRLAAALLNKAVDHLRLAVQYKPNDVDPLINLGNALMNQNKLPEAMETYQRALAIKPNADAHMNLGWAYNLQGDSTKALDEYLAALTLDATRVPQVVAVGEMVAERGNQQGAIAHFDLVLQFDPNNQAALKARQRILSMQSSPGNND